MAPHEMHVRHTLTSFVFPPCQWCQQSFLSTENYQDAMKGLRMTRKYRLWTLFARHRSRATLARLKKLAVAIHLIKKPRKTLVWTRYSKLDSVLSSAASPSGNDDGDSIPSVERADYDARTHNSVLGTPAMTHSSIPLINLPRQTSDESDPTVDPRVPSRPRIGDDSSIPLVQRASQDHQQHEIEAQMSNEYSNDETPFFEQGRMHTSSQTWPNTQDPVQNRKGYHRANSDPGFSHDPEDDENVALGI